MVFTAACDAILESGLDVGWGMWEGLTPYTATNGVLAACVLDDSDDENVLLEEKAPEESCSGCRTA